MIPSRSNHSLASNTPSPKVDGRSLRYVDFTSSARELPVVCEFCDSVYRRRALQPKEFAHCTRCGAKLYWATRLDLDHLLALTLTTAIVFVIANVCPVIRISAHGLHNEVSLLQSITALSQGPALVVGLIAGAALFVVPLLQIVLFGWVLLFARTGQRAPGFAPIMRILQFIHPWSMTEVFLLGVLVAIVKLSGMLQVIPGPGTYATFALTFLIILIAKRDLRSLWTWLPETGRVRP